MAAEKDDSRIVPVHFCRVTVDAAYIVAWMIDYCNLIGRKVVFETSETCFWGCFTLFSQWIRTMRKYCIDTAYLHHWLSVTIHFNRYNHSFDKCTECRDKCKPLYFIALHIRVVPPLFSLFVECPLSDTRCWVIGHFRRCVTERLLNTKVVVFLGFLWFAWTFSSKEVDLQ